MDAHGNTALENREVIFIIAVHLVHGVSALVEDGEHVVDEIVLIVMRGETDIAVVEVFREGVLNFA